jgi:hypothetical protein
MAMYELRDDNGTLVSKNLMLSDAKLQGETLHEYLGEHYAVFEVRQVWTSRTLSDKSVPTD